MNGFKDVENRSWRTKHRGTLLIHASSSTLWVSAEYSDRIRLEYGVTLPQEFELGGIVGVVEVVECVKRHSSKWKFPNSWGWVLENPWRLPFRPCKGFVGLFKPQL